MLHIICILSRNSHVSSRSQPVSSSSMHGWPAWGCSQCSDPPGSGTQLRHSHHASRSWQGLTVQWVEACVLLATLLLRNGVGGPLRLPTNGTAAHPRHSNQPGGSSSHRLISTGQETVPVVTRASRATPSDAAAPQHYWGGRGESNHTKLQVLLASLDMLACLVTVNL